jgi:thiol-disulfide isomerase/thioredoxin
MNKAMASITGGDGNVDDMLTSKRLVAVLIGVMLLVLTACEKPPPPLNIKVGQTLPEVAVKDLHRKPATLALATGKVLVVNVWATWCGPCRHEMPSLDRLAQSLDPERFAVVGLSVDTDDHVVREFLIEREVGFENYMDPEMTIANSIFGIRAFPSTLIFGPNGRLLKVIERWREWDTRSMIDQLQSLAAEAA